MKLKKIENLVKETFRCGEYIIEISETDEAFEAWIYSERYGVKMFMFGAQKRITPLAEFIEMVDVNFWDYMNMYHDEYED